MLVPPPHQAPTVKPPRGHYRWSQTWRDLFFAHWRVPVRSLRPHVPDCLEIDTWHGDAWISIVAFRLDVRLWRLPNFGLTSNFVELNLRTYVRWRDEPGIQFLSIHAGHRLPVALARIMTPLPYDYAPFSYLVENGQGRIACCSRHQEPLLQAEFSSSKDAALVVSGSLDEWLLERYRAHVHDRRGNTFYTVAKHRPWSIHCVEAQVNAQLLGLPWRFDISRPPDEAHFADQMTAVLWPFSTIQSYMAVKP